MLAACSYDSENVPRVVMRRNQGGMDVQLYLCTHEDSGVAVIFRYLGRRPLFKDLFNILWDRMSTLKRE